LNNANIAERPYYRCGVGKDAERPEDAVHWCNGAVRAPRRAGRTSL